MMSGRSAGTGETSSADMPSFSDTVFEFLDEKYPSSSSENSSAGDYFEEKEWDHDHDQEEEEGDSHIEKRALWDEQERLLQGILCRTSSIESKVRIATKEALRKLDSTTTRPCGCKARPAEGSCKDCLRRGIVDVLSNTGFNCSIRKSKWKSSSEIPSGEHTYIEVVGKPSDPNKGEVSIIIELNLRGEFEMAKASHDYDRLVKQLPELYVGKPERLRSLIKVLCRAAKKCMKEKKMHLGPWRRPKYMQAKWLGPSTEVVITTASVGGPPVAAGYSGQPVKARASMLTLSLVDKLHGPQCQAVAVI